MASAEGEFPKIGNDPIYASELNGFLMKEETYSNIPEQIVLGTTYQIVGSHVLNNTTGSGWIVGGYTSYYASGVQGVPNFRINVSGTNTGIKSLKSVKSTINGGSIIIYDDEVATVSAYNGLATNYIPFSNLEIKDINTQIEYYVNNSAGNGSTYIGSINLDIFYRNY